MEQAELNKIIEQARLARSTSLYLRNLRMASLPESIGSLVNLTYLDLGENQLTSLPNNIGSLVNLTYLDLGASQLNSLPESIGNLVNLTYLDLGGHLLTSLPEGIKDFVNLTQLNQLTSLPESIGNLSNLTHLNLDGNQLTNLPESIGNLVNLTYLHLERNQLTSLPESIGNLVNLTDLNLEGNQLTNLPKSIKNLSSLKRIDLTGNPLVDLSVFKKMRNLLIFIFHFIISIVFLPIIWLIIKIDYNWSQPYYTINLLICEKISSLETVRFFNVELPRRYWTKFSKWKSKWLLDENNAEIRRTLIAQVGYEKICRELNAVPVNTWREYTLLKIDGVERVYNGRKQPIDRLEPMVLLKMTCPSTQHIHILRVPPKMKSAEKAITWVNHGIHPDKFAIQT